MQYVHISDTHTVADAVATTLIQHLGAGERVAWLVSGGSAIALEVAIAEKLQPFYINYLTIGLMDERYGPRGHSDENYTQLMDAGFTLPFHRVLNGDAPEKTTSDFGAFIENILNNSDFSIGFFGIGPDGHTAGLKPHSLAVTATGPAVYYEWDDYQRITITPPVIQQLDEAVIYAVGEQKSKTLQKLIHETVLIDEQPAQVLKGVKTATLYTNLNLEPHRG